MSHLSHFSMKPTHSLHSLYFFIGHFTILKGKGLFNQEDIKQRNDVLVILYFHLGDSLTRNWFEEAKLCKIKC